MARVFIAIGSNLGDRSAHIDRATQLLGENEAVLIKSRSSLIETEPVGGPEQGLYLNGVIEIETDLLPLDLLSFLKNIERRLGRKKSDILNSPRSMDLDILFYDDVVIVDGKNIQIPHPRIAERYFVLKPLSEIAPDWIHPRLGKTVVEMLEGLTHESSQELREP